jgi:cytochrome c peroxidase
MFARILPALAVAACLGAVAAAATGRPVLRGLDLYMPVPEDNPLTPEKVALGRRLFSDRRLSRDGSMACATCHDPDRAFTDGRTLAIGYDRQRGTRNVPTIVNRGYGSTFFWDGRAASLEAQVLEPIQGSRELASSVADVVASLRNDLSYRSAFAEVFGREPSGEDLARALASYVRSIQSGDSPFDRHLDRDARALSRDAKAGLTLFNGRANCWLCHVGPTFSDERFHNTGVAWRNGRFQDPGRAVVTGEPRDRGAFKTPTLREVARTGPYMHDGSLRRLEDVVEFYSRGGRPNPNLDPLIEPLRLTSADQRALVAFLRSLSGTIREGP